MANMTLNGITVDQLADRRRLLASFDSLRRDIDASGAHQRRWTPSPQRALGVLTSSRLLDALDLSAGRPTRSAQRYGDGKPYKFQYDGAPTVNDQLLMARRLVEAGVRVRDAVLRPLGQPRQELRPGPRSRRQARSVPQRPDRRPGRARHARTT